MRKYKVIFIVIFLSLTSYLLFYMWEFSSKNSNFFFKCESDVTYDIYNEGQRSNIDALYVLMLGKENQGVLHISGVYNEHNKKLELDRTYYFTYQYSNKVGIYTILISKERTSKFDSVNSDIFHTNFLPEIPGEKTYIKVTSPEKDIYFFEALSYPLFMCTKSNI
ncbi:FidL-like protein [Serratia ureilytica]|uniref:FidL-like protein n=1 Tax=Serratia ureilytica TaxID=300181 RepID=UPI0034C6595E